VTGDPLLESARWCARLADLLGDVGRRAAELGESIARDWAGAGGREWGERMSLLGSHLGREADAAAELGEAYARRAADAPVGPQLTPGRSTGMRLGGTEARRVDDERGMRIAELDPPG
jgi:hypothetical protein